MEKISSFRYGEKLILYAARRGYTRHLIRLVEAGADIEVRDTEGEANPIKRLHLL